MECLASSWLTSQTALKQTDSFTKERCSLQIAQGKATEVMVAVFIRQEPLLEISVSCRECGDDFLLLFDLLTLSNEENKLKSNHKCREVWVPANVISPFPFLMSLFYGVKLTSNID